mgnify:FL=1
MSIENPFNNPVPQQEETPKSGEQEKSFLSPEGKSFDEGKNTLLLDLDKSTVDLDAIKELAEKKGFEQKGEFHITVLGFKNGGEVKKALKALPEPERQNALVQIKSLVDSTDWNFTFDPKRYHISKEYVSPDPKNKGAELRERRESYIQMVDLPGMKIFYDKLNAILGTNLEAPPAHITLYTGGDDKEKSKMGIGINTESEFLKMNPELIS